MRKSAWILMLALACLALDALALDASLDRQQVYDGDTLTLTIKTDGSVQGGPDLAPLKKDFEVLDSSNFSHFSFINGVQSSSAGWKIKLRPRRLGDLSIPPIDVGGHKTPSLRVHVAPVPPEVAQRNAERLFVETEIDSGGRPPYVQQQVRLVVRLYYRVKLVDGQLSEPQPDGDVVFERMGGERRYEATRNGRRYQVLEREYAMFPQRSGELHIPSVVFNGYMELPKPKPGPGSRGNNPIDRFFGVDPFFSNDFFSDPFFNRGERKRITVRSPGKTLQVRPRPADYKGTTWLPAADLQLRDSWTDKPPELRAGEPVTRILTLRAKGLEASQLPELDIAATPDFKVYPEQPVTRNTVQNGWVTGEVQRQFAIVPTHPGRLVMPEMKIHWWDTQQERERETVLPRWELKIAPGTHQSTAPAGRPPATSSALPSTAESEQGSAAGEDETGLHWRNGYWLVVIAAALLILLLWITVRTRRRGQTVAQQGAPSATGGTDAPSAPSADGRREALRKLRAACAGNEPRAVARALLELARSHWPDDPPLDLAALAARYPEQAKALQALDRALYAGADEEREWRSLCEACKNGFGEERPSDDKRARQELPPLYPQA